MLTVRELLGSLELELLAGADQLDAPVRWVHITELLDPTPWLSGGELVLTTGLQLDTAKRQREFVNRLADHQLAGLGIGTGFAHATAPKALLEAARERDFPLFEVPYELPFIAVTEAAFTRLVNEQYAVLRRSIAAHERLERIVLEERGLDSVVAAIASLIGGAVIVADARGEPLVQRTFRRPLDDGALAELRVELRTRTRDGDRSAFAPTHPELAGRTLALPVAATGAPRSPVEGDGGAPRAWLIAAKDAGGLSELDRLTLHQAVTIVALEMLRSRVAEDTERRLAGDVLTALVSGELAGPELARRLEPFGLGDGVAAFVVARPLPGRAGAAAGEAALVAALREESVGGLAATTGEWTCALLPGLPESDLYPLAERLAQRLAAELGVPIRAGAGRGVPSGECRRSFHEARCAVEALALGAVAPDEEPAGNGAGGRSRASRATVATYRDLGSFQLLLSLQDDEALRLFCDSILGPIEASEGPYGGELMRSLEAFIEENGQWERAAKRLYCHRHTLRYRIRKVEEITGRSLSSARDRIEFWLALRGRELVS
ncbi:MAG: PucR family transcriptional regulator ligand-binding domain-containing protein [Solirubrobacteraceae bacterium]